MAVIFLSVFAVLCICELGIRGYQWIRFGLSPFSSGLSQAALNSSRLRPALPNILDDRLGWRPTANFHFTGTGESSDGSRYALNVNQNDQGFRSFGEVSGNRPRLLVLGDSFTQALEVSDEKTYYALLGRSLSAEVFAIGSSGYGTLQEYLLMDQVLDTIHPHLILWQFCYNDFMNNSYALELAWKAGRLGLMRPYWENKRIVYRLPQPHPWVRQFANRWSRLLYLLTTRLDKLLMPHPEEDALLRSILVLGMSQPDYRAAAEVTDQLMGMVAQRAGKVPVVIFDSSTTAQPFFEAIRDIARRHHFYFIEALPGSLDQAQAQNRVVFFKDKIHWNEEGHRLVAHSIKKFLHEAGFFD